jgi:outer membrane receptor protein involved in Fe transport
LISKLASRRATVLSSVLLASTMLTGVSAAFAQDTTVGEVIVTAQKRSEDLQDVPVSIQAIGSEKLEALVISDFNDYVKFLPSVSFQSTSPGFSSVYMRGVASGGDGNHSGSLPSVGIYLDEQPITTIQGALDVHVYDMERVEALAGPQGTLYGASSQAGTIRLITKKPDLNDFSGAIDTEVNSIAGGDMGYGAEGYVNLPLSENAALRVVGWYQHDGGYIDNIPGTRTYPTWGGTINNNAYVEDNYNDVTTIGGRMALKIDLNDTWTVTPTLMGQNEKTHGNFSFDPNLGDLKISRYRPEWSTDKWYQAALTVEGKLGSLDLIYAGAYMKRSVDADSDYSDYSFFYDTLAGYGAYWVDDLSNPVDPTQYTQSRGRYTKESHEFRLSTPGDLPVHAVAGLFYQNQTHRIQERYLIDGIGSAISVSGWPDTIWLTEEMRTDTDYAAFADVTWDINDSWTLTGGVRFFKAVNGLKGFFGYAAGNPFVNPGENLCFGPAVVAGAPCTNVDKETEETGSTHRVNLTYNFDDDHMVYATWSTGYRPGGINRRGTLPPYKSDFLTNYEMGWKTTWFDRSLRWNGAVYMEQWEDFQFSVLGASGLTEIRNAPQAEIFGVETDFIWRATPGLTFSGGAAYTDAQLSETYCGVTDPSGHAVTDCPSVAYPDPPQAPSGQALPVTPKFKANLTARYEFTLGDYDAHLQGSMVTQTSSWADLRSQERGILGEQSGWTAFDMTAGVERQDWTMEFFVQNLTDERASLYRYTQCRETVCGAAVYTVPNQPRTIGLRLGHKF